MADRNAGEGIGAGQVPGGPDALVTLAQLADLEVIAATIPVGIFRTEFERGIVYVNDRLLDIVGLSRDDVLGGGWTKAIHPDDRERVDAKRAESRSGSGETQVEYRILQSDGAVRWVAVRASPFFDDAGDPVGVVGAAEDVTDRVAAEEDAARLAAVCEQTTDFVIVSDVDGRILYGNAAAQRVLGVDPTTSSAELDESPELVDSYAVSSRTGLAVLLAAAAEHGTARGELSMLAADGREVPVSQVTLGHRTRHGDVECYSTVARDISREKSTERQLLLRGAKLRSLVEQAADLVIVLDERGIVTNVGESLQELTGAEPDAWVGRRLVDLVDPADADGLATAFISARFGGAGACEDVMYRVVRPDGSEIWFESRISNLMDDESVQAMVAISWDETERITVVEALRESEERFRSLAASSPLGIVYADRDGGHEYVNQRWREIVGIGPDELARFDHIHPEDRDRVMADAQLVASDRRTIRSDYRIIRPDGEIRHVRSSIAPVFDGTGAMRGFVGSTEDITEEVGARAHIDRLAALLESTPDLAFITDRLGRVLYANERAGSAFGMRVGSDLDVAVFPMFGDTSQPIVRSEMLPGVRRDVVWTGELTLRSVDDAEFPVSVVTVAHRDDAGVVDFFSTIARDITHLKDVEAKLIASESWFRSLVNEALDVVSVRDAANNIVYVSPSVRRVLGYEVDEIVNASSRSIEVHPDDLPMLRDAEAEARTEPGRTVRIEYRLRHQDQSWRWVESRITNLLHDPAVHGIVTNSQDVTERRSAEDARARSDSALLALVQASPLAIHSVEADLSVQLWNNACEELFGWSAGEVLGRRPPFVPDDALATVEDLIQRVFAGERIKDYEIGLRTRDERVIDAVLSLAPVRDATGRVVSAMGVIVDVTARKRAEDGLRASQERFKALVHHSSDFL
ncbi:MAG: PAS domain-containing protein, partial [Acidimicrobiia bacterium]